MTGKEDFCSLYIHVPFCTKKCPYCHFFVLPDSLEGQNLFIKAIHKEWEIRRKELGNKEIISIYLGGGTPSLLPPTAIRHLLQEIQNTAKVSRNCEITLEANPERTTREQMEAFKQAGINRVSLGVQSFESHLLQILERSHSSSKAEQAILATFDAGIENISIDLLYELPGQTKAEWIRSLQQACTLPIQHLSIYNLVFEPGTSFHKKKAELSKKIASDEDTLMMIQSMEEILHQGGFDRYEISAFARNKKHSVHNTGYWTARPFLGIGPSAFSYLKGRRTQNIPHLQKWANKVLEGSSAENFSEELSVQDRQKELLAVELRLLEGVDLGLFEQKQGPLDKDLLLCIQNLLDKHWLQQKNNRISLSEEGLLFYDSVAAELL